MDEGAPLFDDRARKRLMGRLAAVLFLGGGLVTLISVPLPSPPDIRRIPLAILALVAIAVGVFCLFAPWERWRRRTMLLLVPVALGLIGAGNVFAGSSPYTYGVPFVLVFVWLGMGHPPWTSLAFAPLAAVAYIVPLHWLTGNGAVEASTAAFTIPVCVLVGETLARASTGARSAGRALSREREESERLREADRLKDAFLQAISHDLRSPVTNILGSALTLDDHDLEISDEYRELMLKSIATNARRLQRLLGDLLDLERLRSGVVLPRRRSTDVAGIAREVIAALNLPREVIVEADEVPIQADPAMVERIVENLLANAEKHTPPESRVWVRVIAEGEGVLLTVEDEGPGVPETIRDRIFHPFERGDSEQPGAGIGLSLVSRFAAAHGGRAWIEERLGGGASFRVFLPGGAEPAAETLEEDRSPSGFTKI